MNNIKTLPKFPCPCCGYIVFSELPGSYEICPICYWEDDDVQLRQPNMGGGANKVSLVEAQKNFVAFGANIAEHIKYVHKPTKGDERDETWRMFNKDVDAPEIPSKDFNEAYKINPSRLYYWKRNKLEF